MSSPYQRTPVRAPRLSGWTLRLACSLIETPGIGRLIAQKTLRDMGLPKLMTTQALEGHPMTPQRLTPRGAEGGQAQSEAAPLFRHNAARPMPTTADYHRGYQDGAFTPIDVAQRVLEVTKASNQDAPPLRALIQQDEEDLLEQAHRAAERWNRGQPLSMLDGVPIALKDEVDAQPYPTTVGTGFLGDHPAQSDATAVARLRAAGALLIGKANMHELGIGVTGINPHHGAARNPYDSQHCTGGSSSGSAAAVASGLCPIALGADGGGSIRIPASLCGIYGLKPTFGRISEHGAAPLCWSVAHLGPMATSPADLALALAVMAGPDPQDPMSLNRPPLSLGAAETLDMSGVRIGVYSDWFDDADPAVVAAAREGLETLVAAGATCVEVVVPNPDLTRLAHMVTIVSEMLASQGDAIRANRSRYGCDVRMNFALGTFLTSREYVHAQRLRAEISEQIATLYEDIDLLATPTTARTAPPIRPGAEARGESDLPVLDALMRFATLGNLTGLPAITCPVGLDANQLPMGLQLMARPFEEALLLRSAWVLDRKHALTRAPRWYCPHPNFR